jgi:regulatory protein
MSSTRKSSRPRAPLDETALYEYAVKALGRRMRTRAELRGLLEQRAEGGERGASVVAAVLARLSEQRYLDDQSYAETYARLRKENEKLGPRRVRRNLLEKGIASALAEKTIDASYAKTNEEALARQYLARKRIGKPTDKKETARVMRRLLAAGFSAGVIYKILRQWDAPDDTLIALDALGDEQFDA